MVKPTFTNVYRDRGGLIGVVEFDNQEDLDLAIRKLDDTEFRNPFDNAYIRIRDESDAGKRERSRSRCGAASFAALGLWCMQVSCLMHGDMACRQCVKACCLGRQSAGDRL